MRTMARELMELHTLGVKCEVSADRPVSMLDKTCGRGYTQQDVTQVAKVLTGWTIAISRTRGGEFRFDERRHEPGSKTVLGKRIGENGEEEGLEVLHMLATSPATAKFISTKLAVRFVSDDASAGAGGSDGEGVFVRAAEISRRCCGRCSIRRSSGRRRCIGRR